MTASLDISSLHPIARRALAPDAPSKLRLGAAKGLLPGLKPADVVTVVALLADSGDAEVSAQASETLRSLPAPVLDGALSAELPPPVVHTLALHNAGNDDTLERLLSCPSITADTVAYLAETGSERLCERIAINEQFLLQHPQVIAKLYMNKRTRMSTADRVLELAVRNGVELDIPAYKEAAAAIQNELILEPSEEPSPDDILFQQTEELAASITLSPDEDTHVVDDEGNESVSEKCKPIWVQVTTMTVSQKIRRAILGTSAERMLLVRDTNRRVAAAAIGSPPLKGKEAAQISASRSVSDDVLRIIATNREWTRNHQIKYNLVTNPRTPLTFATQLIPHLRDHELRAIAKSKNVSGAIATAARHQLQRKNRSNN